MLAPANPLRSTYVPTLLLLAIASTGSLTACGGHSPGNRGTALVASTDSSTDTDADTAPVLSLSEGRAEHTATVLGTGQVLVAGGILASGQVTDSTLLVTPTAVEPGPALLSPRVGHAAVSLPSGGVLIVGGAADRDGTELLDSTELFDPTRGTLVEGPRLLTPRANAAAVAVGDQVLVVGGFTRDENGDRVQLACAEMLDLSTGESRALKSELSMPQERTQSLVLDDGKVMFASGRSQVGGPPTEVFKPNGECFHPIANSPIRVGSTLTRIGDTPIQVGGLDLTGRGDTVDPFDTTTYTYGAPFTARTENRRDAVAAVVPQGTLLVGGVNEGAPRADVELLYGDAGKLGVKELPPLAEARVGHTVTVAGSGRVLVIGGYGADGRPTSSIEVIDADRIPYVTAPQPVTVASPVLTVSAPANAPRTTTAGASATVNNVPAAGSSSSGAVTLDVNSLATLLLSAAGQVPTALPANVGQGPTVTLDKTALQALLTTIAARRGAPAQAFTPVGGLPATPASSASQTANGGAATTPNLAALNSLLSGLAGGTSTANANAQALNSLASALQGLANNANTTSSSKTGGSNALSLVNKILGSLGGLGNLLGGKSGSTSGSGGLNIGNLLGSILGGLGGSGGGKSGAGGVIGNLLGGLFGGNGGGNPLGNLGGLFGGNGGGNPLGNLGGLFGGGNNNNSSPFGGLFGNNSGSSPFGGGGGLNFGFPF